MREQGPSKTAMAAALLRALHLVVDESPPVFDDRFAQQFLPPYQQRFLTRLGRLPERWLRIYRQRRGALNSMRAQILVRARYAEDVLAAARRRGCRHYVILAAGLDSFALRQAESDDRMAVTEIDHPATQQWKQTWLAQHGHAQIPSLEYLPVDFEGAALGNELGSADAPNVVSWLGTTYYLSEDAVRSTLDVLAECLPAGSELVLDYWREPPLPDAGSVLLWGTRIATALRQEPMRSFFEPHRIEGMVAATGWSIREHCTPRIQNERYLIGRGDIPSVPAFAFLLHLERR